MIYSLPSFSLKQRAQKDFPKGAPDMEFHPRQKSVDHNIQLDSLTINLANINFVLCITIIETLDINFKVTVQRSTLSINIHVNMSKMILTHGMAISER